MRPETKAAYPKDWKEISHRAKVRDSFTCRGCGQVGSKYHNMLTVHHWDYNPRNNTETNLITLCQKCHLRLQQGTLPSLIREKRGQLRIL